MKNKSILFITLLAVLCISLTVGATPIPESWSYSQNAAELGITEFDEAPMLKEAVEKGELPPVEDRLPVPEDIMVIEPVDEIGVYGGSATVAATSPSSYSDISHARLPFMFYTNKSVSNVRGEIAKDYELTNNNTELIIYLRRGMKWSDGHPFTVDDILFWWEDKVNYEEINHWAQSYWLIDGEKPEFKKIDNYTLKIIFPKPNPTIQSVINYWPTQQAFFFDPAHYVKQFHKKYNPEVVQIAKEKGYDSWVQYFEVMTNADPGQQNPELPVLGPWMMESIDTTQKVFVRNPYYFAVDTAGNQLPYLDKWIAKIVSDVEVGRLDVLQGNLDFAGRILEVSGFPLYKINEKRGNYTVYPWKSNVTAAIGFSFNQNLPDDEVKAEIFRDLRFRRAMSIAINRNEINEFCYMGMATPMQATVHPGTSYFEDWWAESYAEYGPDEAGELLDEMGLEKNNEGYRLRPDGKELSIDLFYPEPGSVGGTGEITQVCELVKEYWEEVGVKVNLKTLSRELYETRIEAGVQDIGVWTVDRMLELRVYARGKDSKFHPGNDDAFGYGTKWSQWWDYKLWEKTGKQGEEPLAGIEPPAEVIQLFENMEKWYQATDDEEYQRLGKEIWSFHAEQLYVIGTVAFPLQPVIVSNEIHNIVEEAPFSDSSSWWKVAYPVQWFKK